MHVCVRSQILNPVEVQSAWLLPYPRRRSLKFSIPVTALGGWDRSSGLWFPLLGIKPSQAVLSRSVLLLPVWTSPPQLTRRGEEGLLTISQFTLDFAQHPSGGSHVQKSHLQFLWRMGRVPRACRDTPYGCISPTVQSRQGLNFRALLGGGGGGEGDRLQRKNQDNDCRL